MVGLLVAPPSVAYAQAVPGKEVAKRLFEEGVELEKNGDYGAALAKYGQAAQIAVTPGLRFHNGYCLEMLGKLSGALDEYEAADRLARDSSKPDVHAAVIARVDPLRLRIPQIAIRLATAAKDVEVQLDGSPVGAPLLDGRAFRLDPGDHVVTARAAGHRNFVRSVHVAEGKTTTLDVVLDRLPVPAVGAEGGRHVSFAVPIATTAGAVVLVVTGVGLIALAGSAQGDAKTNCPQKTNCDSEQSKVRTLDALALGGFIGGVGLGVLSAVLWTMAAGDRGVPAVAIGARAAFTGGSAFVEGSF